MTAVIGQAQAVIADDEFPCVCRDCGEVMEAISQPRFPTGVITLVTCWTRGCLLSGVTLTPKQYNALSEAQLQDYRDMNKARVRAGR